MSEKAFLPQCVKHQSKDYCVFPFNANLLTISVLLSSFIAYTRRVDLCRTYKHKKQTCSNLQTHKQVNIYRNKQTEVNHCICTVQLVLILILFFQ